jgi:hypothetical protein
MAAGETSHAGDTHPMIGPCAAAAAARAAMGAKRAIAD